ncbi:hypothetical protein BDW02DRAFT_646776 [Decorospora gaudefroyi]|uniref:Uncharacterized protein n=1 Tax=Decorospora gaudefroyi TaxID=184978 RepID=A0A6A5KC44_9PLEO|nr:hypothetical protein BDW02DRAFT_646776 [Decorospora gaudefroyi]
MSSHSSSQRALSQPPHVPKLLAQLVPIIASLEALKCFSLYLAESAYCIPRATLIALLNALPASCTNLELDTRGEDHRKKEEEAHVCDAVRGLLPRMHNIYRCLRASAQVPWPSIVGYLPVSRCSVAETRTISLVQNTLYGPTVTYGHLSSMPLTQLVAQQTASLKESRIYAMIRLYGDSPIQGCETQLRTDLVAKTTWAFPIMPFSFDNFIVRLNNDSEIVCFDDSKIEPIYEGLVWKDVVGGARLPSTVLDAAREGRPSFATGCVELKLSTQTGKEWAEKHPRAAPDSSWRNEKVVGKQLWFAEKRTGDDYVSERPIYEINPEGWVRVGDSIIRA